MLDSTAERGRATRESLQQAKVEAFQTCRQVWPEIQRLGMDVPALDDAMWNSLDDDGNGAPTRLLF